uniref:Uncharacterized protein n=1 Tax=Rhizophora mucronata TaxID=61149 RepID=A0A2P2P594_RHIMU
MITTSPGNSRDMFSRVLKTQ